MIALDDQRAALRVDSVSDRDEEKEALVDFHGSQESVGEVNVDSVVLVQREEVSWVWLCVQLFSNFRRDFFR